MHIQLLSERKRGIPADSQLDVTPTPAPTERLSQEMVLDESTRPSGPAAEPGRSYSFFEQANAQHLVDIHDHLRGELTRLRDLIDEVMSGATDAAFARSQIQAMTLRQNNWITGAYCQGYCRLVTTHHTLEDQAVFPHLREGDPALAPVLDRLEEEHRAIHGVIERVDEALVTFVATPDGIDGLRDAVDLLTDTLLSHLSYEEREIVEPIARLGLN